MGNVFGRIPGIVVLGLGVTLFLTPKWLFPVCEAEHLGWLTDFKPTMRCFWWGQVEMLLGICVAVAGLALVLRPSRDTRFSVGMVSVALGISGLLLSFPQVMGTVCGHAKSVCQVGTEPAMRLTTSLLILLGIFLTTGLTLKRKAAPKG